MSNYIDFQLKVNGNRNSLEQLQNLIVSVNHEHDEYNLNLGVLMSGKQAVISKAQIEEEAFTQEELSEYYVLEDFVNDFYFHFYEKQTYYNWHGKGKGFNLGIWNDSYWQRLSINENSIIINGTAKDLPPIIHTIAASKLFPDLHFTLSFHDSSDEMHPFGSIEGEDGHFAESNIDIEHRDILNGRKAYTDGFGNWFYSDSHEYVNDDRYIERFAVNLYDKNEPNHSKDYMSASRVVHDNLKKSVLGTTSVEPEQV